MAVDMFLKIEGVVGESVDKVHKDSIDVLAWSWGMANSGTTHQGGGGGSGKVSVQDISFTKYIDKSSPELMIHCCTGEHFPQAKLTVRKAGGKGGPIEYVTILMKEVLITSISTGGSGGEDRLTENVTLNFAEVAVDYTPQKPDGSKEPAIKMTWNIAENCK